MVGGLVMVLAITTFPSTFLLHTSQAKLEQGTTALAVGE